ncbi:MAG: glycosyltransferase [Phocaeicola sp.]|uniref:glycosyltransferase n=1 Tax=Phocaeicola TaxID=909656 RepID=UPI00234E40CD|nr:glycosyltransferase [Phocaeicola oris]MCE2617190.1 glycosyltransferase [Phocaeicola oris]
MKILQVITSLRTGGAEKLVIDLVPRLREKGNQIDVALFDGIDTPFKHRLKECGCKVYDLGHSMYSPMCIFKLIPLMKLYDVVHTHNTSSQLYAAIANKFVHTKLVTTEHSTNNRRRSNRLFYYLDQWMYKQYDHIVCISDKAKDNLISYLGKKTNNIVTIYNGVDVEFFQQAKPNMEWRKDSKPFVIVMVASLHWQKDQDTVIKSLAYLPKDDFEFWIVGDGNRKWELQHLIENLKVESIVKFWGIQSDIAEILHTADVVIMSSHFEGLSLSSIEGMSVGKPFIASDVDGLHEIVKDAGLLFPHQDAEALSKILLHLRQDKEYSKQVADTCYEKAKQYDISKMVGAYDSLYKSLK